MIQALFHQVNFSLKVWMLCVTQAFIGIPSFVTQNKWCTLWDGNQGGILGWPLIVLKSLMFSFSLMWPNLWRSLGPLTKRLTYTLQRSWWKMDSRTTIQSDNVFAPSVAPMAAESRMVIWVHRWEVHVLTQMWAQPNRMPRHCLIEWDTNPVSEKAKLNPSLLTKITKGGKQESAVAGSEFEITPCSPLTTNRPLHPSLLSSVVFPVLF